MKKKSKLLWQQLMVYALIKTYTTNANQDWMVHMYIFSSIRCWNETCILNYYEEATIIKK